MTNPNPYLQSLSAKIYKETGIHIPPKDPQLAILLAYENRFFGAEKKIKKSLAANGILIFTMTIIAMAIGFFLHEVNFFEKTKPIASTEFQKNMTLKYVEKNGKVYSFLVLDLKETNDFQSALIGKDALINTVSKKIYVPINVDKKE